MPDSSISILNTFKKALCKTPETEAFSKSYLDWIDARREDWNNDKIRVGVIGVTSSGKSTVINSILGADILSSAVTPSTGQLVSCTFGKTLEAIVYFENGKHKVFSGAALRPDNLKRYTDETYNLKNKEKVVKIELTSPHFALDKDVMLVDSPGLDAYGLESHEKLTLESLVPTIDACVYVVTMKASSDQKTKEVLDVINRYSCPIIIVQNKLDSVLPSVDGKKSKAQVAEEHRNRVKRIVDRSEIKNKGSVSIIQMSAKDAKDGRIKLLRNQRTPKSFSFSNYEIFIKTVNAILEAKRPEIEYTRKIVVLNRIRESIDRINEATTMTRSVPKEFYLKELKGQVDSHVLAVNRKYETALKDFARKAIEVFDLIGIEGANEVRTQLNEIVHEGLRPNKDKHSFLNNLAGDLFNKLGFKNNRTNFDEAIPTINKAVDKFIETLKTIEKDYFDFVEQNAVKVHIPPRDLKKSLSLQNHIGKIYISEKTVQRTRQKKQKGGWAKVKRFFDIFDCGWGYDEEVITENVYDYETMKQNIVARVVDVIRKDTQSFESWYDNQFEYGIDKILQVINQEEEAFNNRQRMLAQERVKAQDLKQVKKELQNILNHECNKGNVPNEVNITTEPRTEIDQKTISVTPVIAETVYLTQNILQLQHRCFAKELLERIQVKSYEPVIITWDKECVNTFLWQTGIKLKSSQILMMPEKELTIPSYNSICYFVFVDAPQIGSALKQINKLRLDKITRTTDCIIWVVQDFEELRHGQGKNGSAAVEGLKCVQEISDSLRIINGKKYVWLLHSNPIVNFAYMVSQIYSIADIGAEQKLLQELRSKYPNNLSPATIRLIEEIIRY